MVKAVINKNIFKQNNPILNMNKRGQELSISTIIMIILGLAVLVVLVIGFTIGWQKIIPWISSNNVDTIVNQCQAACSTNNVYGYCSMNRTLKADDLPKIDDKTVKEITATCYYFSTNADYLKYNIAPCPGLCS